MEEKSKPMEPYYQDKHVRIYNKDCQSMDELPDGSVQCVVTSPPYWGLRKYAGEQELIWGGDKDCEHQWGVVHPAGYRSSDTNPGKLQSIATQNRNQLTSNICSLCGAWKGAYGLEPTPEMYVQHTIEILREIRRVLRKDGVVFWNCGDSYAGSWGNRSHRPETKRLNKFEVMPADIEPPTVLRGHPVLKPKDLCLIPFRVAIALQEDGWWIRSVIIWSKPNPMPESVTDRPTESHEYILMLTKNSRYYWDADAVREPHLPVSLERTKYGWHGNLCEGHSMGGIKDVDKMETCHPLGRNIRTVWEFPTQPYPEAHFAVFPGKLPEICIKAATPEVGCCGKCGASYERISERQTTDTRPGRDTGTGKSGAANDPNQALHQSDLSKYRQQISYETLGWKPSCNCNAPRVPSLVLDPLMGAGTTLQEAKNLNRYAVGYDLAEEYCQLTVERCRQQVLL